jgi:hypothetical protein
MFSTREIVAMIAAVLVAGALTVWLVIVGLNAYLMSHRDDPLARQGGLKPEQDIRRVK